MNSNDANADIVIVDDDLPGLILLSDILTEHGYSVRGARDGVSALRMISIEPPEIVLLDIHMPGMDGFQVCERLKAESSTRDIPVVFISAKDDITYKIKAFEMGGVDYIERPFQSEEILARIKTQITIARLHSSLSQRLKELSALHQISRVIAFTQDLPSSLEVVCKKITEILGLRLAFIVLQENDAVTPKSLIGFDKIDGKISLNRAKAVFVDMSLFYKLKTEEKSSQIANLQSFTFPEEVHTYIITHNLQSSLIAPLISKGVILGFLLMAKDEIGSRFDRAEIEIAETVAVDIAAAIENDQLTEKARLAVIETERRRFARELHDSVTQLIYSLTLQSSGWESMARQGTLEDPAESFRHLGALGQQALREMRLLLHQLRHSDLEKKGLVNAIQQRLDSVERRANIDAVLVVQGELSPLPKNIEDELFSITQEALNNSLRHARANSIKVCIKEESPLLTLSIEDDGIGFDISGKHAGMGLINLQERAQSIDGEFSIRSEIGHGARVAISVEIKKE